MKMLFYSLLLLSPPTSKLNAQEKVTDTGYVGNTHVHIGKEFSDLEMMSMSNYYDSLNRQHIGKPYFNFEVNTIDGKTISTEYCKGKVTLILFWLVTGGDEHIPPFNALYDLLKRDTNFQMISITPEGDLLPDFLKGHAIHFPIAVNDHYEECHTMNYRNGFPSFILLNKAGIVAMVEKGGVGPKQSLFTSSSEEIISFIYKLMKE